MKEKKMISVVALGNLTKDPEIKEVRDTRVAKFSIASNRNIKKGEKDGEPVYESVATFLDCESWGGVCKVLERWGKGDTIMVCGELEQQNWEKDGVKHSKMLLRVDKVKGVKTKDKQVAAEVPVTESDVPF